MLIFLVSSVKTKKVATLALLQLRKFPMLLLSISGGGGEKNGEAPTAKKELPTLMMFTFPRDVVPKSLLFYTQFSAVPLFFSQFWPAIRVLFWNHQMRFTREQ